MQQLIRNDGGKGDFKEVTPPMLEIWDQLLQVSQGAATVVSAARIPSLACTDCHATAP